MEEYQKAIKEANKKELDGRLDPYLKGGRTKETIYVLICDATLN